MQPTTMTTDDALKILTDVTARVPLVRADQQVVLTALEVVRQAITPKPADPTPPTE